MTSHLFRGVRRVLMTADTMGGVWTYALELAKALGYYDIEISLATMGAPLSHRQWSEADAVSNLRIFESDFKLEWMEDPWGDVHQAGKWLLQLEANLHPDVVHLNGYTHAALPWRAPVLCVGHSCVFSWWSSVRRILPPSSWDEYRSNVRRGLAAAGMVVAPTRFMLDCLETHYGPLGRKRIIPGARSLSRFQPADKHEYVFAAGRVWDEAKNLAALERVSLEVLWPVFVAGEEGSGGSKRFSNLHLLGHLSAEEIGSWFSHTSIFADPARYEPFGLSVLEAGLSGCALVLGDIPSLRETWDNAAVFVNPDNSRALGEAINNLIVDPAERRRMAIKARTRALRFMPGRMGEAYRDVYFELLRQSVSQAAM